MLADVIKFIESSFSNPPIAVIVAETLIIIFLLRGWIKHISRKIDKVLGNQVLATIDRQSMDAALDRCLPGNGKSYAEHKRAEKDKLIQELADKELITKKKTFFSL